MAAIVLLTMAKVSGKIGGEKANDSFLEYIAQVYSLSVKQCYSMFNI